MKKIFTYVIAFVIMVTLPLFAVQATENGPGDKMMEYALIWSIGPSVDKALADYFKDPSKRDPQWVGLGEPSWTAYFGTNLQDIRQLDGEGVAYDITVKIVPWVGAHSPVAEFEQVIRLSAIRPTYQETVSFKHIKDIPYKRY
jgi:hypothetical protein